MSQEIEGKVLSNSLDLGFVGHPVRNERLTKQLFLTDDLVVIISPGHNWAKRKTIQPHQLIDQSFLVSRERSGTRSIIEEGLRLKGITFKFNTGTSLALRALLIKRKAALVWQAGHGDVNPLSIQYSSAILHMARPLDPFSIF